MSCHLYSPETSVSLSQGKVDHTTAVPTCIHEARHKALWLFISFSIKEQIPQKESAHPRLASSCPWAPEQPSGRGRVSRLVWQLHVTGCLECVTSHLTAPSATQREGHGEQELARAAGQSSPGHLSAHGPRRPPLREVQCGPHMSHTGDRADGPSSGLPQTLPLLSSCFSPAGPQPDGTSSEPHVDTAWLH